MTDHPGIAHGDPSYIVRIFVAALGQDVIAVMSGALCSQLLDKVRRSKIAMHLSQQSRQVLLAHL